MTPDTRGEVRRDGSGQLAASSPNEPEHRYENLNRGNDKVYQEDEHYMDIVS